MRSRFVNAKKISEAFVLVIFHSVRFVSHFLSHYPALLLLYSRYSREDYTIIAPNRKRARRALLKVARSIEMLRTDTSRPLFSSFSICFLRTSRAPEKLKDRFDRRRVPGSNSTDPRRDVKIPLRFSKATLKSMKPTKLLSQCLRLKSSSERFYERATGIPCIFVS